jgi:acetyl-CoA carboxylase carboxyl transferase subunit beta
MALSWSFFRKPKNVKADGVFAKCEGCQETVPTKDLDANLGVCPRCGHHHRIGAIRRIEVTVDEGSFEEYFEDLEPVDPLGFVGRRSYSERVADARERTGLREAAIAGTGRILGRSAVIACTDFGFLMGSMGSVVGEKITRAIELATERAEPVIIFSGSGGGARMDEGMLSLMQMAKTSAAVAKHDAAGLLYISVITNPTYAGVAASFASLGDIIVAEPRAQTGFTGPRVIRQTMKVELPEHFQESEFMLEHGQIDMIVERHRMRETLHKLMQYAMPVGKA